jgi:hypothetical protein
MTATAHSTMSDEEISAVSREGNHRFQSGLIYSLLYKQIKMDVRAFLLSI